MKINFLVFTAVLIAGQTFAQLNTHQDPYSRGVKEIIKDVKNSTLVVLIDEGEDYSDILTNAVEKYWKVTDYLIEDPKNFERYLKSDQYPFCLIIRLPNS